MFDRSEFARVERERKPAFVSPRDFLAELRRRDVYKVAVAYGVAAWLLIQIATQVFPFFEIPAWTVQLIVLLLILGFPVAMIFAWAFELTPEGIKREDNRRTTRKTGRKLTALAVVLAALAAGLMVFRFVHSHQGIEGGRQTALPPTIESKSIAVLPFDNLSDEKENAFFADGMQDEIITDLAKVAELKVISRTSTMQYRTATNRNLREIAQALGVAHVVEGSVQRAGGRVRVRVQLIDARNDIHIWAEAYDRDLADVFALQSKLSEQIVAQLQARLSPTEKAAIERRPTTDIAAYDLYLRAKVLDQTLTYSSRGGENLFEGVRLLDQAIARDPEFFIAYCELAQNHDKIYLLGLDRTPARLALAEKAAQTAVRLRPNSGDAHLALAHHLYCILDYDRARAELAIAQQSLPNEPRIYELAGYIDRRQNRREESAADMERALELDPQNTSILQQISLTYESLRRFQEMAAVLDRALQVTPDDPSIRVARAFVDLEWRADPKPLQAAIDAILLEQPEAAGDIAQAWLYVALCQRDWSAVARALQAMTPDGCREESIPFPHAWCEGMAARARGDAATAQAAFTMAKDEIEKAARAEPENGENLCAIGLIDAGLGRKEDAIREGRRAVDLIPIETDAINGTLVREYLSVIYAWVGEEDLALKQLEVATKIPRSISYGQLRLHPFWDPLRSDPRFEKIVASLAPAEGKR